VSDLIAIGYPDEETAHEAADEVMRLSEDLLIEPDAVAVIVRDRDGRFHVTTNHHPVAANVTWGLFWGFLFGLLFFVPLFGLLIGVGLGAIWGGLEKLDIDKSFQEQVRDMMQPGTSALFLIVEKMTTDRVLEALSKYGGTVLKTSLSEEGQRQLQEALHGAATRAA